MAHAIHRGLPDPQPGRRGHRGGDRHVHLLQAVGVGDAQDGGVAGAGRQHHGLAVEAEHHLHFGADLAGGSEGEGLAGAAQHGEGVGERDGVDRPAHQELGGRGNDRLTGGGGLRGDEAQHRRAVRARDVAQPDAVGAQEVTIINARDALEAHLDRTIVGVVVGGGGVGAATDPESFAPIDEGARRGGGQDLHRVRRSQSAARIPEDMGGVAGAEGQIQAGRGFEISGKVGGARGRGGKAQEVQPRGGPLIIGRHDPTFETPDVIGGGAVIDEISPVGAQGRQRIRVAAGNRPHGPLAAAGVGGGRGADVLERGQGGLPKPDVGDGAVDVGQQGVKVGVGCVHLEVNGIPAGFERDGLREPLGAGGAGEAESNGQQESRRQAAVGREAGRAKPRYIHTIGS